MEVKIIDDKRLVIIDGDNEIYVGGSDGERFKELSKAMKLVEAKQILREDENKH